jgi:hypothetical protein
MLCLHVGFGRAAALGVVEMLYYSGGGADDPVAAASSSSALLLLLLFLATPLVQNLVKNRILLLWW